VKNGGNSLGRGGGEGGGRNWLGRPRFRNQREERCVWSGKGFSFGHEIVILLSTRADLDRLNHMFQEWAQLLSGKSWGWKERKKSGAKHRSFAKKGEIREEDSKQSPSGGLTKQGTIKKEGEERKKRERARRASKHPFAGKNEGRMRTMKMEKKRLRMRRYQGKRDARAKNRTECVRGGGDLR